MTRTLILSSLVATLVAGGAVAAGFGGEEERMRGPRGGFDFAAVDTNSDGKVTPEELDAFKAAEFAKIDTDGNGTVSAAELAAHMEAERATRMTRQLERMIDARDGDGDGLLSAEEMAAGPRQGTIFDHLDTDGDGAISQAELEAGGDRMRDRMAERGGRGHGERGHGERGERGHGMDRH